MYGQNELGIKLALQMILMCFKVISSELFDYLKSVNALFPEKDPLYSAEKEMKYIQEIVKNKLPELEKESNNMLSLVSR